MQNLRSRHKKDIDKYGILEKVPIAKNYKGDSAVIMVTDEKGYADQIDFLMAPIS